jgi:hypothetical protein
MKIDGNAWIGTNAHFDEERGVLIVGYQQGTYALSVRGTTHIVKHEGGKDSSMAASYRRIGDK